MRMEKIEFSVDSYDTAIQLADWFEEGQEIQPIKALPGIRKGGQWLVTIWCHCTNGGIDPELVMAAFAYCKEHRL